MKMEVTKKPIIVGSVTAAVMLAAFTGLIALLVRYKLVSLAPFSVVQVAMDIFTLSLGLLLFLICMQDRSPFEGLKLRFLILLTLVYAATFADAAVWVTEGHAELRILSIILDTVLFTAIAPTSYAFFSYVMEYLGIWKKKGTRVLVAVMRLGAAISVLFCFINLFYPVFFSIDQAGAYHRETFYELSNLYAYIAGVVTALVILFHRKRLHPNQTAILLSFVLAPAFALVVNKFFYGLTPACSVMLNVLTILYTVLNVGRGRVQAVVQAEMSTANALQTAMLPDLLPEMADTAEYDLFCEHESGAGCWR